MPRVKVPPLQTGQATGPAEDPAPKQMQADLTARPSSFRTAKDFTRPRSGAQAPASLAGLRGTDNYCIGPAAVAVAGPMAVFDRSGEKALFTVLLSLPASWLRDMQESPALQTSRYKYGVYGIDATSMSCVLMGQGIIRITVLKKH